MLDDARRRRLLFLLFLLAFSVRVVHLLQVESSLFAGTLVGDENTHLRWGELILAGDYHRLAPFFRGPLYGFFIALPLGIFDGSLTAVRLVQMFLGSATVVITVLLGLELFSPFVALAGGIFLALYPLTVYFEGQLLLTSLFTFLAVAGLFFGARAIKARSGGDAARAGLFMGLAFLTRPTILPFAAIFAVLLGRRSTRGALVFTSVFLPLIFVTPLLNYSFGGGAVLFPTQGGINFHVGNAGSADGVIPAAPKIALKGRDLFELRDRLGSSLWMGDNMYVASRVIPNMGREELLTDRETSSWWYAYTLKEILREPASFAARIVRKSLFLAGAWEPPNNTDPEYVMSTLYPFLGGLNRLLNFFVLFACALPGIGIAWRRYPGTNLLLAYLLMMSIVIVAFFVTARFRMPLVPVMALYLGVAIEWALGRDDPARFRGRTAVIAGTLFAVAIGASQLYRLYGTSYQVKATEAMMHHTMARAYLDRGDAESSLREVTRALEKETNERYAYLHTKSLIESRLLGDLHLAVSSLEESLALAEHPETLRRLAVLHGRMGDRAEAMRYLERFTALRPEDERASRLLQLLRDNTDEGAME